MALIVDLSTLRQNPGRRQHESLQTDVLAGLDAALTLNGPVSVEADFVGGERMVEMQARVQAKLDTVCDMCLAPVSYTLDFEISETLMSAHDVDVLTEHGGDREAYESENWIYDDVHLDLNYLVLNAILTQLPLRHLCRPDCKGLCPQCGANLNDGPCNCENTEIDPRWAALMQLKDE